MLSLLKLYFLSRNFTPCRLSSSVVIFVRHVHVQHFQSTPVYMSSFQIHSLWHVSLMTEELSRIQWYTVTVRLRHAGLRYCVYIVALLSTPVLASEVAS